MFQDLSVRMQRIEQRAENPRNKNMKYITRNESGQFKAHQKMTFSSKIDENPRRWKYEIQQKINVPDNGNCTNYSTDHSRNPGMLCE